MRSVESGPWPWAEVSSATDRGARHDHDLGRALASRQLGLVAVAHGMGGAGLAGVLGAAAVVDALDEWVADGAVALGGDDGSPEDHPAVVALRVAHGRIRALPRRDRRYQGIGAVAAVVAAAGPDRALVAHVGDARVHRLRGDSLEPLTTDHARREESRRPGSRLTSEPAAAPLGVVTRALGLADDAGVEARWVERQPGDLFVLASSGLGEALSEDALVSTLTWRDCPPDLELGVFTAPTLAETCQRLVALANRAGAPHNLAVALARG